MLRAPNYLLPLALFSACAICACGEQRTEPASGDASDEVTSGAGEDARAPGSADAGAASADPDASTGLSEDAGRADAGVMRADAGAARSDAGTRSDAGGDGDGGADRDAGVFADSGRARDAGRDARSCVPRAALCDIVEPVCPEGQVPEIVNQCYGSCIRIDQCPCSDADDCPQPEKYTCHRSAQHCDYYVN